MVLSTYINGLQKIVEENPEAKDLIVVYSCEEGWHEILCNPTILDAGIYNDEDMEYLGSQDTPNAINICP